MQKSRNSRRSACDRCRNYKLRCQRSSTRDDLSSCDRCYRTGATCMTTISNTASATSPGTQRVRADGPSARHGTLSQSTTYQSVIERSSLTDTLPTEVTKQGETGSQPRLVDPIELIDLEISSPLQIPQTSNDFTFTMDGRPGTQPASPKSHEQINHLQMMTPLTCDELACFGGSGVDLDSLIPAAASSADSAPNQLQVLFSLCAKLAGDLAIWDSNHLGSLASGSPRRIDTAAAVENALSSTANLSDIIRAIKTADSGPEQREQQQQASSMGQDQSPLSSIQGGLLSPTSLRSSHSWEQNWEQTSRMGLCTDSRHKSGTGATSLSPKRCNPPDIIFTTTLVNAYILLIRVWRKTYLQLHHILQSKPQGEISELLGLPSLQLGGYSLGSNPTVQIMALLQLSSSMLEVIETSLGLGNSIGAGYGRRENRHDNANPLHMDAVSVSVRETLLSQEAYHVNTEEGELSLRRIMDIVREQLDFWR